MTTPAAVCCSAILYIDYVNFKYRGDHVCNLPEGHKGSHTDGVINWIGG